MTLNNAALFEPSIKEVVIIDPPTSHKQGPYFLNVLRVLDIPEALGLLAPRVKLFFTKRGIMRTELRVESLPTETVLFAEIINAGTCSRNLDGLARRPQ